MSNTSDSLSIVPLEELPQLRDSFLVEWPKYVTAWNTLDSQYRNIKNHQGFPVQVYVPYGNKENGVVVIWEMIPNTFEISLYCLHEDHTKIKEALISTDKLDWSGRVLFSCVREELVECASDILRCKMITPKGRIQVDNTYITHIDRNIAKHFNVVIPPDVKIENARPEHAAEIDGVWPHRYQGSEEYFKKMIGYGLTTALVGAEKGELRGWVLTSIRGDEHALQVKDEYKCRGYGQLLVKWLGKKLANDEREVFGCVVTSNMASQAMFRKMDFKQLHITSWIVGIHDE